MTSSLACIDFLKVYNKHLQILSHSHIAADNWYFMKPDGMRSLHDQPPCPSLPPNPNMTAGCCQQGFRPKATSFLACYSKVVLPQAPFELFIGFWQAIKAYKISLKAKIFGATDLAS